MSPLDPFSAHSRIASPTIATTEPTTSDRGVGWASQSAAAPRMNPAVTRRRAIHTRTRLEPLGSATRAPSGKSALDGCHHFGHTDVFQAPVRPSAATVDVTPAHVSA